MINILLYKGSTQLWDIDIFSEQFSLLQLIVFCEGMSLPVAIGQPFEQEAIQMPSFRQRSACQISESMPACIFIPKGLAEHLSLQCIIIDPQFEVGICQQTVLFICEIVGQCNS